LKDIVKVKNRISPAALRCTAIHCITLHHKAIQCKFCRCNSEVWKQFSGNPDSFSPSSQINKVTHASCCRGAPRFVYTYYVGRDQYIHELATAGPRCPLVEKSREELDAMTIMATLRCASASLYQQALQVLLHRA